MAMRVWATAIVSLVATSAHATAQDRFVAKLALPTGETAVVAEGDFEARSLGSFSVRLYGAAEVQDETTFFTSGLIRSRAGVVEKAILADVDDDQRQEIVVIVRSVGTGSYLSAHAFATANGRLIFRAAVEDLAADADPVAALRRTTAEIGTNGKAAGAAALGAAPASDARVPGTPYHATGRVRCSIGSAPAGSALCDFGVIRGKLGNAEVRVARPDGFERVLTFIDDKLIANGDAKVNASKSGDLWLVDLDDYEHYRIPDSVIIGD